MAVVIKRLFRGLQEDMNTEARPPSLTGEAHTEPKAAAALHKILKSKHLPKVSRSTEVTTSDAEPSAEDSDDSDGQKEERPLEAERGCGGGRAQLVRNTAVIRTKRLMKEYQDARRKETQPNSFFSVELVEENLYEWDVKLRVLDQDSVIARDMRLLGIPHVLIHMSFPDNFPFAPPFMHVLSPRIDNGFVLDGGAICMELLTPSGWASAYTVESIILQFSASLVKGSARLNRKHVHRNNFSRKAAKATWRDLVRTHEKYGWVTPPKSDG